MIVSKNIKPEKTFYYLGAKTIKVLLDRSNLEVDFFDVFAEIKKEENISINLFCLTLDWLYVLGVIDIHNGKIAKCF